MEKENLEKKEIKLKDEKPDVTNEKPGLGICGLMKDLIGKT